MGNGMNKVLPGLYVGNYRDSKDPLQLHKYKITHILSIHDAARRLHNDKHYLCIMASDSPDQNLTQYFSLCNDFIHAARLRDGNVLIHCLAGMSRSVTVAVAYIMSVTPLTWREALKVVRAGRTVANPNIGFRRQLQDFETNKLLEERRRLKERYPSLALADSDLAECRVMLDSYQTMLSEKTICEGKCAMGRQCPTGVCRTGSKRQLRPRRQSSAAGGGEPGGEAGAGGIGMKRSPSTLSTASTASGYRPRSSPAGLYSYTGATARPSRSASGIGITRVSDAGATAIAVGGSEYSRRRAASAPATPAALSPATSPPGSPHRGAMHRGLRMDNSYRSVGSRLYVRYRLHLVQKQLIINTSALAGPVRSSDVPSRSPLSRSPSIGGAHSSIDMPHQPMFSIAEAALEEGFKAALDLK